MAELDQKVNLVIDVVKQSDIGTTVVSDKNALVFVADDASGITPEGAFILDLGKKASAVEFAALNHSVELIQTSVGEANGLASLDSTGKVKSEQLPAMRIGDTFVVASEAEMLALKADQGDIAIRSDLNQTFRLVSDDPSVLADWVELLTPDCKVTSVNGKEGAVIIDTEDIVDLEGTTSVAVGGIPVGTTLKGKKVVEVLDMLMYAEQNPALTNPSNNFAMNVSGIREIGEVIGSLAVTSSTFNRGTIAPAYGTGGLRSGLPNTYTYTGTGLAAVVPHTALSHNPAPVANYKVLAGNQTWTQTVSYDAGEQPKTSKGNNFNTPLSAGTTSAKIVTIKGVYPLFASTVTGGVATKQPLTDPNAGGNYQVTLPPQSAGALHTLWVPATRSVTKVQLFNTNNGQWEDQTISAYWVVFGVTMDINENATTVSYNKYENIDTGNVGGRQWRFFV